MWTWSHQEISPVGWGRVLAATGELLRGMSDAAIVGDWLKKTDEEAFVSIVTQVATVVLGKLTKIEQVHVATRFYPVDVTITQSVGIIPCFLICNQMELKGSGTDDAVVDLRTLSERNVSIDQSTKTVTGAMAPPAIAPADLNPATCDITSSHGSSAVQRRTSGTTQTDTGRCM
jgi:hypothetical protein